jgi:L-2-amino-thiazoline-4-carboxylic acid hydrolase
VEARRGEVLWSPVVADDRTAELLDRLLCEAGEVPEGRMGGRSLAELRTGALERARELEARAPQFRRRMNRGLFELGIPALALYRTLREDAGVEQAPALVLLDQLLQLAYRRRLASPVLRTLASGAFRLPVLRNAVVRAAERSQEPGGFVMRRVRDAPGELLAFDVERCPLAELFAREGAPEVGPLICKLDDVMVEALHGVELRRTGTIAGGATRCDFRYRRSD